MRAMVLSSAGARSLELQERETPTALPGDVMVKVTACGVCRTDLHVVDGELPDVEVPIVPGHEIVGIVEQVGDSVQGFSLGDRVGIPWLGYSCGTCAFCKSNRENLCPNARFTGYQLDGGYADYAVADARYAFRLPNSYGDKEVAPLLCAGLIGYRAYRMVGDARRLGFYGFGAAAHIIAQLARHDGREVYAFTRPGDERTQGFARGLGAVWAGGSDQAPPERLDAAVIFAPVGSLVPEALRQSQPGATIVCAGIHMTDIPSIPYELLWQERTLRSVANLTRQDARDFLALASRLRLRTSIAEYPLTDANRALDDVRAGRIDGAAVLVP
jgi:alcohol dehydrogenase, propanol-preferring